MKKKRANVKKSLDNLSFMDKYRHIIDKCILEEVDMGKMKRKSRNETKLTVMVTSEMRNRLTELQLRLRDFGVGFNSSTPGKLIDILVMNEKALDILSQFFLSGDLSNKDK